MADMIRYMRMKIRFYATVGNGTSVASAKAFAAEYSQKLKADGVDAVILTST